MKPSDVLSGSGRTAENTRVLEKMSATLPRVERDALFTWISTFYGFQQTWLLDTSRLAWLLKCRQIGASHTYAAATVLWAMFGETSTVISIGERESMEFLDKARRHAMALVKLGSEWAKGDSTKKDLTFTTGGRVIALPSSSGGRGYSGSVVLDEAAYYQHPDQIWDAAAGAAMHGGRIRICSTPNGSGNMFHGIVTKEKGYRGHRVTIDDAIADGMAISIEDCRKLARSDDRVFDQLFRCSFLDGEDQYIPTSMIEAAAHDETFVPEGDVYAGLDIGLKNDLSSLTIVRQAPDGSVWEQETKTCKRTDWDEQMRIIAQSYENWGWKRLCVDSSGLGLVPSQMLQKEYGVTRIEPVVFTNAMKETLATSLYQGFADGMLFILNDKVMINDLCSLRRMVTESGAIRFDAPRTVDGHADRAWSLALALHACSKQAGGVKQTGPGDLEGTI